MTLAERLVFLRKQHGLTQLELAEKLNVSRQAISRWEVGTAVPSTDNLKYLSTLYGTTLDYLLNGTESSKIQHQENSDSEEAYSSPYRKDRKYLVAKFSIFLLLLIPIIAVCIAVWHTNNRPEIIPYEELNVEDTNTVPKTNFTLEW